MTKPLVLGWVPGGTGDVEPFDDIFSVGLRIENREDVKVCDALVIWGGADISPSIYNEPVSKRTYASERLSYRDVQEVGACKAAIELGIPIIGVCRGAQLLCGLAGGKLIQHVERHGQDHWIKTKDDQLYVTSSVHHQMMYPWDVEHEMIAWSVEVRSPVHIMGDESDIQVEKEPEIVYFPKIKGLAIQGHPEFMDRDALFVKYCNRLVKEYVVQHKVNKETVNV